MYLLISSIFNNNYYPRERSAAHAIEGVVYTLQGKARGNIRPHDASRDQTHRVGHVLASAVARADNFEFALRDFANLERYCSRESTILIHDCYPLDRETAGREGSPSFWSGDIWRLIVLLKKYRADLAIHTIGTPPTGLGMVRNLDPNSHVLTKNHDQLCQEFLALDYAYLNDDKAKKLNLVTNNWEAIRALLGAS